MAEPSIFDGIALFDRKNSGIHDQVSTWGAADRDSTVTGLSIFGGGTENHKQGWEVAGLAQLLAAAEGRADKAHLDQLDAGVGHVLGHVRDERIVGQCRKEVLASYWHQSALYRVGALRETLRLIAIFQDHQGLRALAGELIVWIQIHRTLLRLFRASNGVIRHPGIRNKHHPELNENFHTLSHCWEARVTDPDVRRLLDALESPTPKKLLNRAHDVIAMRLYRSPEGRRIEELTRGTVRGRLSTDVGVLRRGDGGYAARMTRVEIIPESKDMAPQIVWELDVDATGNLLERVATNDLAQPANRMFPIRASRGEVVGHPLGSPIPEGWLVIGPDAPLPEAPPWTGESGVSTLPLPAPPPAEPEDPEPTPEPEPRPDEPEEEGGRIIPRHAVRGWLKKRPDERHGEALAELVWQAQRWSDGEVEAEARLVEAVEALRAK